MDKRRNKSSNNKAHKEYKWSTGGNKLQNNKISLSPDHELLVWEKWIEIRKEETTKLSGKLHREPIDLAMNLIGKVREDIERKTALTLAQIQKKPGVRGALFERPLRLKQYCYCQPAYEIHRTAAELGHPRVIEHIGVPKCIQENELGMAGITQRHICNQLNADYVAYRQKREKDFAKKLHKIDPYRPSTSNLIVQGFKPKILPPKLPDPPIIRIESPALFSEEAVSDIYAVKINKTVFYKESQWLISTHLSSLKLKSGHENCTSWSYYFNVPVNRAGRAKLYLENLGTVTLKYCWKMIKKSLPFIPPNTLEQVFYFNKNEDVLSPGQSTNICFTFVSDKPGIYNELWELIFTNVCFFNAANEKFTINLYADSVENTYNIRRQVEILKNEIHVKCISNLAVEIINEILEKIFAKAPQTYPYKHYFLEAQLFVMKNPVCFYHQTEVAKMKEMYNKEIAPGQTWDLSISDWRETMMSKAYDDRMKYYIALKKSHSECLKPWYEGQELAQEKYQAVKELLANLANKLESEYVRLTDLYINKPEIAPVSNNTTLEINPVTQQVVSNIFFLHAYDYLATTVELCAGILSSLDSNRWIEFDFCRN